VSGIIDVCYHADPNYHKREAEGDSMERRRRWKSGVERFEDADI
jgi:hypothetical protein